MRIGAVALSVLIGGVVVATAGAADSRPKPAQVAAKAPHVKYHTPYPEARVQLIRQGFDPVRIVSLDTPGHQCDHGYVCDVGPEVLDCAGSSIPWCTFLYRRRADGRYWRMATRGEMFNSKRAEMRRLRYEGAVPATEDDLRGLVVIAADGSRHRFPGGIH